MANFSKQRRNRPRNGRVFRPMIDEASVGSSPLDQRLLLSRVGEPGLHPEHLAARVEASTARAGHHAKGGEQSHYKRLTPTDKIDAEYSGFLAAFNQQLESYVASLNETSTGTTVVSATLTTAYVSPALTVEVDDAAVFGTSPFNPPIVATATFGGVTLGSVVLTGSSGNTLTIQAPKTSNLPAGTVLTATVSVSAANSAAAIFPSYITSSTTQMGTSLVEYFNNLPVKLPHKNGPPHTPIQNGAIQQYVYESIAGSGKMFPSLQQSLLAIPLPTTPGSDLDIYQSTVNSVVAQSRLQVLGGIEQIYAGKLLISATAPANRLGEIFNTGTSGGGTTSSSGTSSSTTAA